MSDIKGIIPPMITPLLSDRRLDVEGLEQLVEHILAGGVHGLFILGTTGEGPSLPYDVRIELIERVCDQVDGRVPVLVGITDASLGQALNVADAAHESGARAVVLAPPFYFQINQGELHDFTERILREVALPLFLYDNPGLTGVKFDLDTVQTLIQHPEVIGFKDSSGDASRFHRLRALLAASGIPLLVGPEELLMETLVMGGEGGVPGGANMFPEIYVGLYDAVRTGELERARALHERIMRLSATVYRGSTYGSSSVINGIKSALSSMGICSEYLATPLKRASPDKARKIEALIAREREQSVA